MALINCEECGKKISDKAFACPNCGCPNNFKEKSKLKEYKHSNNINYNKQNKTSEILSNIATNKIANIKCGRQNNINYNNQNKSQEAVANINKLASIIGVILILILLKNILIPKPNIEGSWENTTAYSYKDIQYSFDESGNRVTKRVTFYKTLFPDQVRDVEEYECTYRFRGFNTQIKISCPEEASYSYWENFEIDGDTIYIDNEEYYKD